MVDIEATIICERDSHKGIIIGKGGAMLKKIGSNAIIGLYVHLCCLVERLVTRNPIETYVGQDRFEEERADFIESFRQSFSSISTRYRVEVPVSEIAYVFDYISVSAAPAREERLGSSDLLLDE